MAVGKNPVSILNELRTGLKYNVVEQVGPSHAPMFKVGVEVDGQTYFGIGCSKKQARSKAAEEALKSFIQFPNSTNYSAGTDTNNTDFTKDSFDAYQKRKAADKKLQPKGAVMLLNELFPAVNYEFAENDGCSYSRFKVIITVGVEKFVGTGK